MVWPKTDQVWFQLVEVADDGYHSYWTKKPTTTPVAESTTDQPIQYPNAAIGPMNEKYRFQASWA